MIEMIKIQTYTSKMKGGESQRVSFIFWPKNYISFKVYYLTPNYKIANEVLKQPCMVQTTLAFF